MPPPSKKRKTAVTAPESITFDPAAREEYLTGFHKRKVARIKLAQEENAKREKEEKVRFRRELRQQRRTDLERHVEEVNRLVRQANGDIGGPGNASAEDDNDEDEFNGFQDPEPINQEDEYIDEDKYTTVTMESVSISKAGFSRLGDETELEGKKGDDDDDDDGDDGGGGGGSGDGGGGGGGEKKAEKRVWTKAWPKSDKPKKKKKKIKFRYESKAERRAERMKQGAKKKKQREAREAKA